MRLCDNILSKITTIAILCVLMPLPSHPSNLTFKAEEVNILLEVLGRLGSVTVVDDSPFFKLDWPHICWISTKELSAITPSLLAGYPGRGSWTVVSDHPRTCLMVRPNMRRGELTTKREAESVAASAESFRSEMVREIPKLADFIEQALKLRSKPSLGVHFSSETVDLPYFEDHAGPGGGIILAADPGEFVRTGLSTSPFDRATHFWLTEGEENLLYLELNGH